MTEVTCDDLQELLGDWVGGDLAHTVIVLIETHLGKCPGCGNKVALYRATIWLARSLPAHTDPLSPAFEHRLRRMLLAEQQYPAVFSEP